METTPTALDDIDSINPPRVKTAPVQEEDYSQLSVSKTSLFLAGDGFTAYDSRGQLVFRVESYGPDDRDTGKLALMDASVRCLPTVHRMWPSLHQRREGFIGDKSDGHKPFFSVRRSSIIGWSGMTVELYTVE